MVTAINTKIALKFVHSFCTGDLDSLTAILHNDLNFHGPLFQFTSRDTYLMSLRNDPPQPGECRILSVTENDDEICVFYEYVTQQRTLTIAQLFGFSDDKIILTRVVFDTRTLI